MRNPGKPTKSIFRSEAKKPVTQIARTPCLKAEGKANNANRLGGADFLLLSGGGGVNKNLELARLSEILFQKPTSLSARNRAA